MDAQESAGDKIGDAVVGALGCVATLVVVAFTGIVALAVLRWSLGVLGLM